MRVLPEVRRDREPPLGIRVSLVRPGEEEVTAARRGRIGARALRDVGIERGPFGGWEDGEAIPDPTRHDRPFLEADAKLGRDGEAPLLVQRVGEFAREIDFHEPFPTWRAVPHRSPQFTTQAAVSPTGRGCQVGSWVATPVGARDVALGDEPDLERVLTGAVDAEGAAVRTSAHDLDQAPVVVA